MACRYVNGEDRVHIPNGVLPLVDALVDATKPKCEDPPSSSVFPHFDFTYNPFRSSRTATTSMQEEICRDNVTSHNNDADFSDDRVGFRTIIPPPLELGDDSRSSESFDDDNQMVHYMRFNKVLGAVDCFNDILAKIKPMNLSGLIKEFFDQPDLAQSVTTFSKILELYGVYWNFNTSTGYQVLAYIVSAFRRLPTLCKDFVSYLRDTFGVAPSCTLQEPRYEAAEGIVATIAGIALSAVTIIGGGLIATLTDSGTAIAKMITLVGNAVKGFDGITIGFTKLRDFVSTSVAQWFGWDLEKDTPRGKLAQSIADLTIRLNKARELIDETPTEALSKPCFLTDLEKDMDDVLGMYNSLAHDKTNLANLIPLISSMRESFTAVAKCYTDIKRSTTQKAVPATIWIYGASGIGKSQFAIKYLSKLLSTLHGRTLTCFSRKLGDAFWSSYVGQDIVIYDDFGAEASDLDHPELDSIYSPTAYQLNMAGLAEKGRLFSSSYVFICTNHPFISTSATLHNPEILQRRRDIVIEMQDPTALAYKETHGNMIDSSHYKPDFSHAVFRRMNQLAKSGALENYMGKLTTMTGLDMANFLHDLCVERAADLRITQKQVWENLKACTQPLEGLKVTTDANGVKTFDPNQVVTSATPLDRPSHAMPNKKKQANDRKIKIDELVIRKNEIDIELKERQQTRLSPEWGRKRPTPSAFAASAQPSNFNWRAAPAGQFSLGAGFPPLDVPKFQGKTMVEEFQRTRIVVFRGPPGIGKSVFARKYEQQWDLIDDFTLNTERFDSAIATIWDRYDGVDTRPLILTCNTDTYLERMNALDAEKIEAFTRRVTIVEFAFKKKGWFGRYTKEDIQAMVPEDGVLYDDMVTIRIDDVLEELVTLEGLMKVVAPKVDKIQRHDDEIPRVPMPDDATISHIISTTLTDEEFTQMETGGMLPLLSKFRCVRGSIYDFIPIAAKFTKCFSWNCGGTVEMALVRVNRSAIKVNIQTRSLLRLGKRCIMFDTMDGILECSFIVAAFDKVPALECEGRPIDGDVVRIALGLADPRYLLFANVVDVLLNIGKLALGGYVMYRNFTTVHSRPQEAKAEGQYNDYDEYCLPYGTKPLPKSALPDNPKKSDLEYCSIHHTFDRCLVAESRRSRFLDVYSVESPGKQRDTILIPEGGGHGHASEGGNTRRKAKMVLSHKTLPTPTTTVNSAEAKKVPEEFKGLAMGLENLVSRITALDKEQHPEKYEATVDPGALDIVRLATNNTVFIYANDTLLVCRGLMLRGRLGVTNNHAEMSGVLSMSCVIGGARFPMEVLKRNTEKDLLYFTVSNSVPQFKDITAHLQRKADTKDLSNNQAYLNIVTKDLTGVSNIQRVIQLKAVTVVHVGGQRLYGMEYGGHLDGYSYSSVNTTYGDCGSAVVVINPSFVRKIIGFHAAGSNSKGWCAMLFQEDVEEFPVYQGLVPDIPSDEIVILKHQDIHRLHNETYLKYEKFGIAAHDGVVLQQFHPEQTKFYRSPLAWDKLGHGFEPACLSWKDTRCSPGADPYEDGMDKWSKDQPLLDESLVIECANGIGDFLGLKILNNNLCTTVLTGLEAINGVSYLPGSNPLYRHSSAGFPFKHWPGVSKKTIFFRQNEKTMLQEYAKNPYGSNLATAVAKLVDTARHGQRSAVVFAGACKDECLKLKKIYDATATRTFTGAPIDYTIAQRLYFHGAAAALCTIFDEVPMKVGIDPLSLDWDDLYHYHAEMSLLGWDSDYKQFDSRVPKTVMRAIPSIYNRIYLLNDPSWCEEDDTIRDYLHSVLHGPLFLYYESIMRSPGGHVTGQPLTALDNCLINLIYMTYAWITLARRSKRPMLANVEAFFKNVRASVYGDDNIMTVKEEHLSWFNFFTYETIMTELGQELTAADKESDSVAFKSLHELEFLKRNFIRVGNKWLGGLVINSMSKMLNWSTTHKAHRFDLEPNRIEFDRESMCNTINAALKEGCIHGEEFYDQLRAHLIAMNAKWHIGHQDFPSYKTSISSVLFKTPTFRLSDFGADHESDLNKQRDQNNHDVITSTSDSAGGDRRGFGLGIGDGTHLKYQCATSTINARGCTSSGTGERTGPISVHTVVTSCDSDMDDWGPPRKKALVSAFASKVHQPSRELLHRTVQRVGRRLRVQAENSRNRIPRWSTGDRAYPTKHRSCVIVNHRRSFRVRIRNVRSQGLAVRIANFNGSAQHQVPLQAIRRKKPRVIRRALHAVRVHPVDHVVHRIIASQRASVCEIVGGFHGITVGTIDSCVFERGRSLVHQPVGYKNASIGIIQQSEDQVYHNTDRHLYLTSALQSVQIGRDIVHHAATSVERIEHVPIPVLSRWAICWNSRRKWSKKSSRTDSFFQQHTSSCRISTNWCSNGCWRKSHRECTWPTKRRSWYRVNRFIDRRYSEQCIVWCERSGESGGRFCEYWGNDEFNECASHCRIWKLNSKIRYCRFKHCNFQRSDNQRRIRHGGQLLRLHFSSFQRSAHFIHRGSHYCANRGKDSVLSTRFNGSTMRFVSTDTSSNRCPSNVSKIARRWRVVGSGKDHSSSFSCRGLRTRICRIHDNNRWLAWNIAHAQVQRDDSTKFWSRQGGKCWRISARGSARRRGRRRRRGLRSLPEWFLLRFMIMATAAILTTAAAVPGNPVTKAAKVTPSQRIAHSRSRDTRGFNSVNQGSSTQYPGRFDQPGLIQQNSNGISSRQLHQVARSEQPKVNGTQQTTHTGPRQNSERPLYLGARGRGGGGQDVARQVGNVYDAGWAGGGAREVTGTGVNRHPVPQRVNTTTTHFRGPEYRRNTTAGINVSGSGSSNTVASGSNMGSAQRTAKMGDDASGFKIRGDTSTFGNGAHSGKSFGSSNHESSAAYLRTVSKAQEHAGIGRSSRSAASLGNQAREPKPPSIGENSKRIMDTSMNVVKMHKLGKTHDENLAQREKAHEENLQQRKDTSAQIQANHDQKRQDFEDAGLPMWASHGAIPAQAFAAKTQTKALGGVNL